MEYRRFGRTELQMPVFSCGGMRFQHSWHNVGIDSVPLQAQAQLEATVYGALELGINHFETAFDYGSSEAQLGLALSGVPRDKFIIQTKLRPKPRSQDFHAAVLHSLQSLGTGYIDLLSFHGLNNEELLHYTLQKNGCLDVARQLQRDGCVRFVGFSTHAPCGLITKIIHSGELDYVNLHWYFVNTANWPAVQAAAYRDMGVLIISPNDKGGRLYSPSKKMEELCAPLEPMQFNDLYCLRHSEVHTLGIGARRVTDFYTHAAALKYDMDVVEAIEQRLLAEMEKVLGQEWLQSWHVGIPEYHEIPGEINILEILRLWTYAKSLDMMEWARKRYNLLPNGGHWFPGNNAAVIDDELICAALQNSPFATKIPDILREAHHMMVGEPQQRLTPP